MFTVAIVGRPNVGKSTLFNRLAGRRLALVDDTPGLTRDRREADGHLGDLTFRIIDTAGYEDAKGAVLEVRMREQTDAAIAVADLSLFLIDARAGVTALDEIVGEALRRAGRPVIVIANKCESDAGDSGVYEAYALGLGDPVAVSAEHGEGMSDLYDALRGEMEKGGPGAESAAADAAVVPLGDKPWRIAVVGRPNVGKSTLINRMLGEERVITGPEAGITRDSISVDWSWHGHAIKLFDTAGLRRRMRVTETLEKLSVGDTLRAIRFAEVVVLLMDAEAPFEKQDVQIADLVGDEGRALVVGLNKWDLIKRKPERDLDAMAERLLSQLKGVPLIRMSALTGAGLDGLMEAVAQVRKDWSAQVKTSDLNRWLAEMEQRHPPPAVEGRPIRLRYMSQIKTRPPTFMLFASRAKHLPESYKRYLINGLREAFNLPAVPIRLTVRQPKNPYAKD